MSSGLRIALFAVVVIALMGGSFYGGTLYGKQQSTAAVPEVFAERMAQFAEQGGEVPAPGEGGFGQGRGGQRAFPGQGGTAGGGRIGQIQQIEGNSITIATMDGTETVIIVADTTLIEKYASVSPAELELGEQIVVSGNENDDGSITARSIQVAQFGRFAPGGQQ